MQDVLISGSLFNFVHVHMNTSAHDSVGSIHILSLCACAHEYFCS
uniref:Uncharacterized protein n=1 Tax=Arundo donax TaxID=35708 RepID=A0A0A9FQ95_ARUDO